MGTVLDRALALGLGVATVVAGLVTRLATGRRSERARPAVPPHPTIFVVGCPRSGTTWVADILGRHPAVIRGPESHVVPSVHHAIGVHGRRNPVAWARLFYAVLGARRQRVVGLHHYVGARELFRIGCRVTADARDDGEACVQTAREILDTFFARERGTTATVLVEKTPAHVLHVDELFMAFPEARVVVVLRDGRDVCVSMALRNQQRPVFPTTTEGRIRWWMRSVEAGRAAAADPRWCDRVTTVRYEALKADPVGETTRLFDAVDLPADAALVDETVERHDIAHYPRGAGEFRHRGEVGTWSEYFDAEDERVFRELAGELFEASGYRF